MRFTELSTRLLNRLRRVVESGAMTESALSRRLGISQPHLHNTFKGVRGLTLGMADQFLNNMNWTVWDLCEEAELREELSQRKIPKSKCRDFPVRAIQDLDAASPPSQLHRRQGVPRALLAGLAEPALFCMDSRAGAARCGDILLVDLGGGRRLDPGALYLLRIEGRIALRWVRKGARWIYLIRGSDWDHPQRWERVEAADAVARIHAIARKRTEIFLPPDARSI
jgi:AraC-like DNA-binding protein